MPRAFSTCRILTYIVRKSSTWVWVSEWVRSDLWKQPKCWDACGNSYTMAGVRGRSFSWPDTADAPMCKPLTSNCQWQLTFAPYRKPCESWCNGDISPMGQEHVVQTPSQLLLPSALQFWLQWASRGVEPSISGWAAQEESTLP